ncbi:18358_t:CDS:2 [Entrophospora sp. SA101]|nr:18358_t:CDS:2 [Entrophospora sp. SA101]
MIVFNSCKYLRELDAAENVIKELVTLKGNNISMAYLSINNYPLEFLDFVNCVKLTNLNLDSYGDNIEKLYLKCDHINLYSPNSNRNILQTN